MLEPRTSEFYLFDKITRCYTINLMPNPETRVDAWMIDPNFTQPKKQIGDYVESHGFLVPRRFEDIDQALSTVEGSSGIIVRSEHREEYDGPSGIAESVKITSLEGLDTGSIIDKLLEDTLNSDTVKYYNMLIGNSVEEFAEGLSFTHWEYIPGTNMTVVADDTVPNQYYILHIGDATEDSAFGWSVVRADGTFINSRFYGKTRLEQEETRRVAIELYEGVKCLPAFASQHAPLIEMQMDTEGAIHFLQYHRGRDKKLEVEALDASQFDESEGWIKAKMARGSLKGTHSLGLAIAYPDSYGFTNRGGVALPNYEPASAGNRLDVLSEIMSRRRTAYIETKDPERALYKMAASHDEKSSWFKPEVSFSLGRDVFGRLFLDNEVGKKAYEVAHTGRMARIMIDLASDGANCFVRINPDVEQPVLTEY